MSITFVLSSVLVLITCWQRCHATETAQVNVQYDTPDDTDQYNAKWPQASLTTPSNSVETETEGASSSNIRPTGFSENIFSSEEIFTSDEDGSLPAHNKSRQSTQAERMRRQAANATHPRMLNDETDPKLKKKPIKGSAMTSTKHPTAESEEMSMTQVSKELMKLKAETDELRTRVVLLEKNADSKLTNLLETFTQLQRENKALREELLKISDNMSGNIMKVLNNRQALRAEMLTISNNMSGNMTKLLHDNEALRTTVSSLNTTAGEMNSQLHKLSEMTSNLQKQNTSIYSELNIVSNRDENRQKEIKNQKKSMVKMTAQFVRVQERIDAIQTKIDKLVYFKATFREVTLAVPRGIVVFDQVLENVGRGYNPKTGVFTAPYDGLYAFTVHVFCIHACTAQWFMTRNRFESHIASHTVGPNSGSSYLMIYYLRRDSVIHNAIYQNVSVYGYYHSMFSGWLVRHL